MRCLPPAARLALALVILAAALPAAAQPPGRGGAGGQPPAGRGLGGRGAPPRDAAASQPIPAGTAVIAGSVVVAGAGQPARRARVTLNAAEGGGARTSTTDEEGRYAFTALAAGRYTLSASKPGHVSVVYGSTWPGRPGTPIQLADGERFSATLHLARGSVITGTVLDEHGEPVPRATVRALRYVMQAGRRTLQPADSAPSDDRGIYRIYGLQPGDYLVSVVPRNQPGVARIEGAGPEAQGDAPAGYAPVYYPGTVAAAQAGTVAVGIGEERGNVDVQLQRMPMARLEGVIVNATGQAVQGLQVTLVSAEAVPGIGGGSARADAEGRFRLTNVAPGSYRLVARGQTPIAAAVEAGSPTAAQAAGGRGRRGPQSSPLRLWGAVDIVVDGRNQTDIVVPLQAGLTVSGRVVFDGTATAPPADLTRIRVSLAPAEPSPAGMVQATGGAVDASGRFTLAGVVPGLYRLTASGAGSGWSFESSSIDGQDSIDFPFEVKPGGASGSAVVTFSDRQAQLSGTIVNRRGQAAPEQTLILYPADERYWVPQSRRIRSTRPATDGQFTFAGIPAGEYRLVALVDVEPGAWFDPAFLQQVNAASTPLTIADGEKKVQHLQISTP